MTSLRLDKFGIFKAYDVRGRYPEEINELTVAQIAGWLGGFFGAGRVVIGRDNRLSSPRLYAALRRNLKRFSKIRLIDAGLLTTPALYFLVNDLKAKGGVMITASHNPKEYNGLKIVGSKAQMVSGEEIYRLMTKRK